MLTARHRDDPSDAGLAKLREEVANLAERLRDAEAKLEAARNSHAAALQRHAAADRQLGEWTHKLAARDTIVKSDPILAAVLTA